MATPQWRKAKLGPIEFNCPEANEFENLEFPFRHHGRKKEFFNDEGNRILLDQMMGLRFKDKNYPPR